MKERVHKPNKPKRRTKTLPPDEAPKAMPPPDDPLRRAQQDSDLNAREMAQKRWQALNKVRESSSSSEEPKSE